MAEIRVRCECGKGLLLTPEQAGKAGRCPQCGRSIVVPEVWAFEELAGRQISVGELEALSRSLWRPGQIVDGRYLVQKYLGHGGCGIVWKAQHTEWNLDLAVKEFIDASNLSPEKRERRKANFIRESHAWVDDVGMHPHVVTAWYVRKLNETPYLFLEYCDGGDLHSWIEDGRTRDLKTTLDIAIQLAWGLAHCHEKRIVHRDFKPLNVMMTADGTAKITDFGMVKFAAIGGDDEDSGQTNADDIRATLGGGIRGTPPYMPPEQWERDGTVDHRADLYALGVTVFELLIGRCPITLPSPAACPNRRVWLESCAEAHMSNPPASLREERNDVPVDLYRLVQQCLAKNLDDRPAHAGAVVAALLKVYEVAVGEPYHRPQPSEIQPLADGLNNRGVSLLDLGDRRIAEQKFKEAIQNSPHHVEATFNLGLLRWRNAAITDADLIEQLREVCASHPKEWLGKYLLAQVCIERGDDEGALTFLESIEKPANRTSEVLRTFANLRAQCSLEQRENCSRTFQDHRASVTSVAFTADGRYILSGSADETIRVWDAAARECLRTIRGHTARVTSVSSSVDSRYAISGSNDETVRLWDIRDGNCVRTFTGHTGKVTSVCLSTDGRFALSGSVDKTIRLWDADGGTCERTFDGHKGRVTSVSVSTDSRYVLSGSRDTTMRLWDIADGRCLRIFRGHEHRVRSVTFSNDSRLALSGSDDNTMRLWDVASGKCLSVFVGHTLWIASVAFSADCRLALSGSGDDTLRLWDVRTGRCLRTIKGHRWEVTSVSFSPDGRSVLSGSSDNSVRLWTFGHPGQRKALYRLSRIVDTHSLLQQQADVDRQLQSAEIAMRSEDFRKAAAHLRRARMTAQNERQPRILALWADLYSRLPRARFRGGWHLQTFEGHESGVRSIAFSSDARYLLSGSWDNLIRLWEVASGKCVQTFDGHTDGVESVTFSADGGYALSASRDHTVRLWDVASGACLRTFEGHAGQVNSVSFSADGRYAVSGGGDIGDTDNSLRLWDIASGECVRTFKGHSASVDAVSISPNGRYALSGSWDTTMKLWDAPSGACLRTFHGHQHGVTSVTFSADGRFALSGCGANKWLEKNRFAVEFWDVFSGKRLQAFDGHTKPVTSVSLSADGRYALSASEDKTLRLWSIGSGKCLRILRGHREEVVSVSFSGDCRFAVSASRDNTIRLWFLDWELENREPADWDHGARPYMESFLTLHTSRGDGFPKNRGPAVEDDQRATVARDRPRWDDTAFQQLLHTLGCAGYGWLRPEGVKKKLLEMAADWTGPPPLFPDEC